MAVCVTPGTGRCGCVPMSSENSCSSPAGKKDYFHEVCGEMAGNQLIIRMQKDKNKNKKGRNWDPPCDCQVIEIKRPKNENEKPKIVNGGDNNQILFRIHSKSHLAKKEDQFYRPQAIAYQINKAGTEDKDNCRKITVYPQFGGPISQEVYTDHISGCKKDVYLLRVRKKDESVDSPNKPRLEVELHTPKAPKKKPPPPPCKPKCVIKPECEDAGKDPMEVLADKCAALKAMLAEKNGPKPECKPKPSKFEGGVRG